MANTNNYAESWSPELLEVRVQNTLCSPFMTTAVKWVGARTFHFTQMTTGGFMNHKRDGGWNTGKYVQTDAPFTLAHDRDIQFLVDKAYVDETNQTASVKNISATFEKTQAAPESDALFFSRVAAKALTLDGYHSSTALTAYTKANVFDKLKEMLAAGKLRRYKAQGALVMYVASEIMNLLEQCDQFNHEIEMTRVAEGGLGIETRMTYLDGVPLIEVIDDERFYTAFDWEPANGGFAPAAGAYRINVLIASPLTTKLVPKISSIYYFAPGTHTEGDGYLYQNRELSDVFTFPNGKDGRIDSIYVDVDTTAVAAD